MGMRESEGCIRAMTPGNGYPTWTRPSKGGPCWCDRSEGTHDRRFDVGESCHRNFER